MSTIPRPSPTFYEPTELHNGDRMTQEEFHRVYEKMPEHIKAELIGGIVYVASPLGLPHGRTDPALISVMFMYCGRTPGVEVCSNTTVKLGRKSEPQPDTFLRVLPEYGGQSRTTDDEYVEGAPELVAEVAHSSRSIDLGAKRTDYARNGVREYIVLSVVDQKVFWFDLPQDRELPIPEDGILRSLTFPGLWIDVQGLLSRDATRLMTTLEKGLASPEHAAFVSKLEEDRQRLAAK